MKPTRREALVTIAGLAVPAAHAQPAVLSAPELVTLTALVDTIIPRTDTPGASDAGVPAYIDRRLQAGPQLAERVRAGLRALDADSRSKYGVTFSALTSAQRIELLTPRAE